MKLKRLLLSFLLALPTFNHTSDGNNHNNDSMQLVTIELGILCAIVFVSACVHIALLKSLHETQKNHHRRAQEAYREIQASLNTQAALQQPPSYTESYALHGRHAAPPTPHPERRSFATLPQHVTVVNVDGDNTQPDTQTTIPNQSGRRMHRQQMPQNTDFNENPLMSGQSTHGTPQETVRTINDPAVSRSDDRTVRFHDSAFPPTYQDE